MSDYSELIGEYAKNPPNNYKLDNYSISHNEESRVCGDTLEVFLKIDNNTIKDYSFIGNTSIITTASASIFGESIQDQEINSILEYNIDYIKSLIGEVSPKRKHAATLALLATRNAIHKYLNDGTIDDFSDVLE